MHIALPSLSTLTRDLASLDHLAETVSQGIHRTLQASGEENVSGLGTPDVVLEETWFHRVGLLDEEGLPVVLLVLEELVRVGCEDEGDVGMVVHRHPPRVAHLMRTIHDDGPVSAQLGYLPEAWDGVDAEVVVLVSVVCGHVREVGKPSRSVCDGPFPEVVKYKRSAPTKQSLPPAHSQYARTASK